MALPALFQFGQEWQQKLFTQGSRRVQRHDLVDAIVQRSLVQLHDRLEQRLALRVPVIFDLFAKGLRGVEQLLDLANGDAAVEPGEDRQDALHMLGREQSMALGCALRHDQAITPFPGAQGDGVHAGLAGHFANGQPAFIERFLEVAAQPFAGAAVEYGFHQIAFRRLRFSGCGCR
ncbi:hypothetical protein D3C87_1174570 [compost metagenome]